MSKFKDLYAHVSKLGLVKDNLYQPSKATIEDLAIAHDKEYLEGLYFNRLSVGKWRRIGLPHSEPLIERTFTAPNGTLLAAELALEYGIASHLAGGTHHAHRDFGSGFCMINDLAYAALSLIDAGKVERVLIFDLDVHQGDGTASILQGNDQVFTCSIHCEKNFPFRKSASDLDIGLPDGMGDVEYIETVNDTLDQLFEEFRPNLVLYDAGVDVWQHDSLGRLDITWNGLFERDEAVLKQCIRRHTPVATVIGGGYDKNHSRLAERHGIVMQAASGLFNQCF